VGVKKPAALSATSSASAAGVWAKVRSFVGAFGDPRLSRVNRIAFWFSIAMLGFSILRLAKGNWGNFTRNAAYHAFVILWMLVAAYGLRTVGIREIVRFWLVGFFPVALIAYVMTEPVEALIGVGNLQTGVWVPLVEELVKIVPLVLWTTRAKPRHLHGSLTDFLILGFAVGAGFSFQEDALYERVVASGFTSGFFGKLFPMFLDSGQFVITHAGWAAIGAVGVGILSLYRRRPWIRVAGAALILVPIVDHMAVNWRGTGSGFMLALTGHGYAAAWILLLVVVGVIVHDTWMLRAAASRDTWFPSPTVRGDYRSVSDGSSVDARVRRLLGRQRYRRRRNAAYADLHAVRSRQEPAGDRSEVVAGLAALAREAQIPQHGS